MFRRSVTLDPISDFLIVQVHDIAPEGKIILPNGAERDNVPRTATVLAAGPGLTLSSGHLAPMPCGVGDVVVLQLNAGTEVRMEGADLRIVPARDLFGVVRS